MNMQSTLRVLVCLAVTGGTLGGAEPEPTQQELIQRLQRAEQRIQTLEARTGNPLATPTSLVGAPADDLDSIAGRLAGLEQAWQKMVAEKEAAKKFTTFKPGGRIHFDYWSFPHTNDGIDYFEHPVTGADPDARLMFRRIRLFFKGDIGDSMLWKTQIDFNNPGIPEYKDVYIGFKNLPHNQQLLIGNQKRPLGMDHLNSSRFNVFLERPLVVEAFNEDARRIGIAMYGYTDDEVYHWRYGLYNLENTSTTGRYIGDPLQMSLNGRLSSSPWYDESCDGRNYFHWAISGMLARPDGAIDALDNHVNQGRFRTRAETRSSSRWINTGRIAGAHWYEVFGLESMLNLGPLQVTTEYQNTWLQRDNHTAGTGPDVHFHGAYVFVAYTLTGEHVPYERTHGTIGRLEPFENFYLFNRCKGGWGAWQVAFRYSYLDLTDADIRGGIEHDATFALNWYWTPHSKVQFNVIYGDIEQHVPVAGFTSGDFLNMGLRFAADF